ncbi:MAG: M14 family metallopeptidase [Proteobacteria bacterium]|nr:M14 family metallopeptidase [Pseudomonadota bacterium]
MRALPRTCSSYLITGAIALMTAFVSRAEPLSPQDMFGFQPGDDYKLASYEQMEAYFRQLAQESDRVELREIGKSVLGRPLFLLTISSAENITHLDRYRAISAQLARARIDSETAEALAIEGKAIVWVDGGLHATELAHGQMTSLLAHRVATEESAEMQAIRDNVIFLLMPGMNPDGLEIVRKWYESQLDTPFEQTNPPELYHHYIGHDNNRDFFMNNMPESKAVAQVIYNEWYPQIVYNQHQSSPGYARIVIPPYSDPVNPIIHPGVTTGLNEIGSAMGNRFALDKMPGAVSDVGYSMWWNGGMRTVPYFHNMIGILTETGHTSPSPRFYDPKVFPKMIAEAANPSAIGIKVEDDVSGIPDAKVLYSYPWEGGESHFSEPVNFMITGSIAVLRAASDSRLKWQTNIYRMGRDAIAAGESGIRGYIIAADQAHDDEARNLVNLLLEGGVEVDRATEPFRAGGNRYTRGTYIINAAQAFRPYVVDLLDKQTYPDTRLDPAGSVKPPYDITGWTLPMQMDVAIEFMDEMVSVAVERLRGPVELTPGEVRGKAGYGYALSHAANASIKAVNQLMASGESVSWIAESIRAGGEAHDAGTFIIASGDQTAQNVATAARQFGVDFVGIGSEPSVGMTQLGLPRVGVYKSYVASMDEGWTRWVIEEYGFDLVSLSDSDVRSGDLSSLDAIILPHQDGRVNFKDSIGAVLTGYSPGEMPDEYTGGIGLEGAYALQRFVKDGGTMLTFGNAAAFAIDQFGLPIRDIVGGASAKDFSIPGSLIRINVDTTDVLGYGMSSDTAANFVSGAAFDSLSQAGCADDLLNQRHCTEVTRGGRSMKTFEEPHLFDSIANYAEEDILMSGWAAGTEFIAGKSALARVPHGQGEVIIFGFRPQFRGQPRGTYKLIFNALLNSTID